jgi:hypothetical protein
MILSGRTIGWYTMSKNYHSYLNWVIVIHEFLKFHTMYYLVISTFQASHEWERCTSFNHLVDFFGNTISEERLSNFSRTHIRNFWKIKFWYYVWHTTQLLKFWNMALRANSTASAPLVFISFTATWLRRVQRVTQLTAVCIIWTATINKSLKLVIHWYHDLAGTVKPYSISQQVA